MSAAAQQRGSRICGVLLLSVMAAHGQSTNLNSLSATLPETGFSLLRVMGALALVLALFLAGVWCLNNLQRFTVRRGKSPRLNVLEVKSLGHRQALYLVACDQQRMLVASSPAGVTLLSHLPEADPGEVATPLPSFAQSLQHALAPKT